MTLCIRPFVERDEKELIEWLKIPENLQWFPMLTVPEIIDAVNLWKGYIRQESAFTAEYQEKPAGMGVLYLSPFQRLKHQCCFAIIVNKPYRNLGIATALIRHFESVAKSKFGLEYLYLEVYEHNPAFSLYQKLGFTEFGRHPQFVKENGVYKDKILMQKKII